MSDMDMSGGMMAGALGHYSMMRDASGTSWQPDSTPMRGIMGTLGGWSTMVDGYITGVFDDQTGPRGSTKPFSESMLMGMAQNQLGPGTLTLRSMFSLDPFMGKSGYPLCCRRAKRPTASIRSSIASIRTISSWSLPASTA